MDRPDHHGTRNSPKHISLLRTSRNTSNDPGVVL